MCAFRTSDNKDFIRTAWNLPILKARRKDLGRDLTYFGLTGPEMLDIQAWQDVLRSWTAVEEMPRNVNARAIADRVAQQLVMTATLHGLGEGLEVLRGSVEDVILDAMDANNMRPPMADDRPAHECRFAYDVYNLDFDGGLGFFAKTGRPKRIRALEALFRRQHSASFVLFLTVNVRDTLRAQVADFLSAAGSEGSRELLEWYAARGKGEYEYQLKAAVPLFLRHHAEACGFDSFFWPPLAYEGYERARMVHFVCLFRATGALFQVFSAQTRHELIGLPLLRCTGGKLGYADAQHPGFKAAEFGKSSTYLPRDLQRNLLKRA